MTRKCISDASLLLPAPPSPRPHDHHLVDAGGLNGDTKKRPGRAAALGREGEPPVPKVSKG